MASTFSNLKFELIGTGDQSGTWGTTTNTNLGTAIEQALVGMATISSGFVTNSLTLTLTDTNAAQNARALVLNLTQALSGAGTLNVPAIQKPYMIINATGQTVTVKVTGLTGVAVPNGTRAFLYNNGTDVGEFFNYHSSLTLGTALPITSGGTGTTSTTFVNLTTNVTGTLPIANGGTGTTSTTFVNLATNVTGTLPVANGGTAASTAPNARTNLGATTVGSNLFTLTNPSAITFLRINADNTVSALDAATFRTAIGAGTTSGAAGSNTQVQYNNAGAFAGSANFTFNGTTVTMANDASVNGLTVGRGAGAVSTNTAVGASALSINSTGAYNTAIGREALQANTASNNTAVGYQAGYSNQTANSSAFFGYKAGYSNTTAENGTFIGFYAGQASTGAANTFIGSGAGYLVTSGSKNTIIGGYSGNQSSLDIRTSSNYIVLSDGDGNPRMYFDTNGIANLRSSMLEQMTISATAATGTINFDAITQSVLYYTTNASGNFTMNVRGSSTVTLNNSMVTGQSLTIAFLCTNGSTAYYQTAMTIDGSSVTPKWQGGTAPSAGNASSIDAYVYTIIKTGAATFTVLASQTKFA